MEKLPSGYKNLNLCFTDGSKYIDTGVAPSSNIDVEIAFLIRTSDSAGTTRNFIFGARDGSSNTSAGINLAKTFSNGYYLSYNTTNTLISSTKGDFSRIGFTFDLYYSQELSVLKISGNTATLAETVSYNAYDLSNIASFSCSKNMYLFGVNNNGSAIYAPMRSGIAYCKIWESGSLVRNYVACVNEASGYAGMYDLVNETFHQMTLLDDPYNPLYTSTWEIVPTSNGHGTVEGTKGWLSCGELIAVPEDGCAFVRWEFENKTISNENPLVFDPYFLGINGLNIGHGDPFNPVAVFVKKTDKVADLGYKMAVFASIPTRYDAEQGIHFLYLQKGVFSVRSASISIDGKQKAASTFTMDGDFNVVQGDYVYVYSQLGKNIYTGVVDSFEENKITCYEMRYIFNKDALFHNNSNMTIEYNTGNGSATVKYTDASISYILPYKYLYLLLSVSDKSFTGTNPVSPNRYLSIGTHLDTVPISYSLFANSYYGDYTKTNFPLIEDMGVKNLYEYVCDLFNEFGIYVENRTIPKKIEINNEQLSYLYIRMFPKSSSAEVMNIGTNVEQITDVKVSEESETTTVLYVFDSTGSQCRGAYTINTDGEVVPETTNVDVYVPKIVLSDDVLNTVVQSNLSASKYNHKITFTVLLDDGHKSLKFDDFKINKRVDFYYGGKTYRSVVTALSYNVAENDDSIHSIKVTLGMARSNLTSKLNLKKMKKR